MKLTQGIVFISLTFIAVACGPTAEEIATQTAAAWTATPTETPIPTNTPTPTSTPTAIPPTAKPTSSQPTATAPPPDVIMANAITVWEQIESYSYEISAQINTTLSGIPIETLLEYIGDYQAPDRTQGTLHVVILGIQIDSEFINIGDSSYTTDATTGEWSEDVESISPFGPKDLIDLKPADMENPTFVGFEDLNGVLVYHISGVLRSEEFGELFGEDDIEFPVDYWISVEDGYIMKISLEIAALQGNGSLEKLKVVAMATFSDFGKQVDIVAPELP